MFNTHQHTYLSPAGCSVIDYLLTDPENFKHLSSFKIGSFCEWSDHAPLCISLRCNYVCPIIPDTGGVRYKWNDNLREQFRSGLLDNLEKINHCVHNVDCTSRDSYVEGIHRNN